MESGRLESRQEVVVNGQARVGQRIWNPTKAYWLPFKELERKHVEATLGYVSYSSPNHPYHREMVVQCAGSSKLDVYQSQRDRAIHNRDGRRGCRSKAYNLKRFGVRLLLRSLVRNQESR